MRNYLRIIVSVITIVAVLLSNSLFALASEVAESASLSDNEELVSNFWESMNEGNWAEWVSYYPLQIQDDYLKFISEENLSNNVGVLAISHAEVENVTRVANVYAPKIYPELQPYFSSESTYECYKVDVVLDVNENNAYFSQGNNSFLTVVVKEDSIWHIGAICPCPAELVGSNGTFAIASGIGHGLISFIPEPETISVMDETGYIHANESFSSFVINATCNEIGNCNFAINAIKAQIIAIKMCGWWAKAGGYRAAYGCDIKYGDVAYKSVNGAEEINQALIARTFNLVDGYYMVSSSDTGAKLFYAAYWAGYTTTTTGGQGCGQMTQYGAQYLASELGYNWEQILHYYYDNSSYNNPNVGIVLINSGS